MIKTLTGIIISILFSGLLIYSISEGYSLMQVFTGIILFIFPAIFYQVLNHAQPHLF